MKGDQTANKKRFYLIMMLLVELFMRTQIKKFVSETVSKMGTCGAHLQCEVD